MNRFLARVKEYRSSRLRSQLRRLLTGYESLEQRQLLTVDWLNGVCSSPEQGSPIAEVASPSLFLSGDGQSASQHTMQEDAKAKVRGGLSDQGYNTAGNDGWGGDGIIIASDDPPTVVAALAAGSTWQADFVDSVDGGGTGVGNGLGMQLLSGMQTIVFDDVDLLYLVFSEDISNAISSNFELRNSDGLVPFSYSYDTTTFVATLTLSSPLGAGKYRLAASNELTNGDGVSLDGDSDGTSGGIFDIRFDVLPGDADGNFRVNGSDLIPLSAAFNSQIGQANYNPRIDWNADGRVSGADLSIFSAFFNANIQGLSEPAAPFPSTINQPPESADARRTIAEDSTYSFSSDDFTFSDPDPGDQLLAVRFRTLPLASEGTLRLGGVLLRTGQVVPAASLAQLTFEPRSHLVGPSVGSFVFQVQDDGGIANGGLDLDLTPNTFTFDVTPVNDPPHSRDTLRQIPKGSTYAFSVDDFVVYDLFDSPPDVLHSIRVTSLPIPGDGSLYLAGSPVSEGQVIPADALNQMTFVAINESVGRARGVFDFQLRDSGSTANGGIDWSLGTSRFVFEVYGLPVAPSTLTTTKIDDVSVGLAWNAVDYAVRYIIERKPASGDWQTVGTSQGALTTFVDEGLLEYTNYEYRVRAANEFGVTPPSPTLSTWTRLQAPSDFRVTYVSNTQINLTWTDRSRLELGYSIEASNSASGPWQLLASTSANSTSYSLNSPLAPGTDYVFRVRAIRSQNSISVNSTYSTPAGVSTPEYPAQPINLMAEAVDDDRIVVQWDDVFGELSYTLEHSPDGAAWSSLANVSSDTTQFTHDGLEEHSRHFYRVYATNFVGNSPVSATVFRTVPLSAPTDLQVANATSTAIELSWIDNSALEDRYRVERALSPNGPWTHVGSPNAGSTSTTLSGNFEGNTTYHFRVRAERSTWNDANVSAFSEVSSVTTGDFPRPPTGLVVSGTTAESISLNWTDTAGASNYVIQRSDNASVWSAIATVAADQTTFTDTDREEARLYYYRILARNSHGDSSPGGVISAVTKLYAPDGLEATFVHATQIDVTWHDHSNAENNYILEQALSTNGPWVVVANRPANSVAATIPGPFSPSTEYFFRVRASRSFGAISDNSTVVSLTTPSYPAQPQLTIAATTPDSIAVDWNDVANAISYRIERSTNGATWETIGNALANSEFTNIGLTENQRFHYRVIAENPFGLSVPSQPIIANTTLFAPSNLNASFVSATQINLAWTDNSSVETQHRIEQSISLNGPWSQIGSIGTGSESFIAPGPFAPNTTYNFRVRSLVSNFFSAQVASEYSNVATTPSGDYPAAPTGLRVTNATVSTIELSWTDGSNETEYVLERSLNNSSWTPLDIIAGDTTQYTDTSLPEYTVYYYRLRAANASGTSIPSAIALGTTRLLSPTNVQVTARGLGFDVTWNDESLRESHYQVELAPTAAGPWTLHGTVGVNTGVYRAEGNFEPSTLYYFRVRAVFAQFGGGGASDYASAEGATTEAFPGQPKNAAIAVTTANSIGIRWDEVANADQYHVERSLNNVTWTPLVDLDSNATEFIDLGLSESTNYNYRIIASNAVGTSIPSSVLYGRTTLETPSDLVGQMIGNDEVQLSWQRNSSLNLTYQIERAPASDGPWTVMGSTPTNATHFVSKSILTPNTTYYYRVAATWQGWQFSNYTTTSLTTNDFPPPPGNLQITSRTVSSLTLEWHTVPAASGYEIQIQDEYGLWQPVVSLPGDWTRFTARDIAESTLQTYRLRSTNAFGESTFAMVTGKTLLNQPQGLSAQFVSPGRVDLQWFDRSNHETQYLVEYSTNADGGWTSAGSVARDTTVFIATGAFLPNTMYSFRVRAVGQATFSDDSPIATVTTPGYPVQPSTLRALVVGATTVTLAWEDVADEAGYIIQRQEGNSPWTDIGTVDAGVTQFEDVELSEDRLYAYRAVAVNAFGRSIPSPSIQIRTRLEAPTSLAASFVSSTQVDLQWVDESNAELQFRLERAPSADGPWSEVAATAANSTSASVVSPMAPNTEFFFRVRGTGFSFPMNTSVYTEPVSLTTPDYPQQPVGLVAGEITDQSIALQWADATNETNYVIERSQNSIDWQVVGNVEAGVTTYVDSSLHEYRNYHYRVAAINASGRSIPSASRNFWTMPSAPTNLQATFVNGGRVDLMWADQSAFESQFLIQRATDINGPWTQIASTPSNAESTSVTQALTGNTTYHYRIQASAGFGQLSAFSNIASLTTPDIPAQPAQLTVTNGTANSISIQWNHVPSTVEYDIQRSVDNVAWNVVGSTVGGVEQFTDQGLSENELRHYRVVAKNSLGSSAASGSVSARTRLVAPDDLQLVFVSATRIDVRWNDNSTVATRYEVEQAASATGPWSALGIANAGSESFTAAGPFLPNAPVYFRVRALTSSFSNLNQSEYTLPQFLTTPAYPERPLGLVATNLLPDAATLQWTNIANEQSYDLERSSNQIHWETVGSTLADQTTLSDTGLLENTRYHYRVRALNSFGSSAPSNILIVNTPVLAPTNLQATFVSGTNITLEWQDNSNRELQYTVDRASSATGPWNRMTWLNANAETWSAPGPWEPNSTLYFRVAAHANHFFDAASISYSSVVSLTTPAYPGRPTGVVISDVRSDSVVIQWNDVSNATSYLVQRSFDNATWTTVGETAVGSPQWTDQNLSEATQAWYRVVARNGMGDSHPSSGLSGLYVRTLLHTPTELAARLVNAHVQLTWEDRSALETGFQIERALSADGPWNIFGTSGANAQSFISTSPLDGNTTYYFRMRANSNMISMFSEYTAAIHLTTPALPPQPARAALVTSVSNTQAVLTWVDDSDQETEYVVQRSDNGGNTFATLAFLPANSTSFAVFGLLPGAEVTLRVIASNGSWSAPVDTTYVVPSLPPVGLLAEPQSPSSIRLSWSRPAGDESRIQVEQVDEFDGEIRITAIGEPTAGNTVDIANLLPATTYFFRLRVWTESGTAPLSSIVSAETLEISPPANVSSTIVSNTQVDLAWEHGTEDIAGFRIERSTDGGATFNRLAWVTADVRNHRLSGLTPGTSFQFRVVASYLEDLPSTGDSAPSNAILVATPSTPPTGIVATPQADNAVLLTWIRPAGDSSLIEIQRSDNGTSFFAAGTPVNGESAVITGFFGNAVRYFRIRVQTPNHSAIYSNVVNTSTSEVAQPTLLNANSLSNTQVRLTWRDNANNETAYRVEWSSDGGATFDGQAITGINATSYTVTQLIPDTGYTFRVLATNTVDSLPSNLAQQTTSKMPPTNLVATGIRTNAINLSWILPQGDTSEIEIERSLDGATFTPLATTVVGLTHTDEGLTRGTTYHYRVRVLTSAGDSTYSAVQTASTVEINAPTDLTATYGNTFAVLSWTDNADNETTQRLEGSLDGGATYITITELAPDETSFTLFGLTSATDYRFRVFAEHLDQDSDASNELTVLTGSDAPTGIAAQTLSDTRILVSWQRPANDRSPVQLEVAAGSGGFVRFGSPSQHATSTIVTGLSPNALYHFRVRVVSGSHSGGPSGIASAQTYLGPPSTPTGLEATTVTGTQINLTWSAATGALQYGIEQRNAGTNAWFLRDIVPAAQTSYAVTNLDPGGSSYSFRVVAANQAGVTSGYSNSVNATTENYAPHITSPATAGETPLDGDRTSLSVVADDDAGESLLIYTWTIESAPDGATPEFSNNGANAAKHIDVTFDKAGDYTFQVLITDEAGTSVTSTIEVTVNQVVTQLTIKQSGLRVGEGKTRQFTVTMTDQFDDPIEDRDVEWSVTSGEGSIDSSGLYTAPEEISSPSSFTLEATLDDKTATSTNQLSRQAYDEIIAGLEITHPESVTHVSGDLFFFFSRPGTGKPSMADALMGDSIADAGVGHWDGPLPVFHYDFAAGTLANGPGDDFAFFAYASTAGGFTISVPGAGSQSAGASMPTGETGEVYWIDADDTVRESPWNLLYSTYDLSDFGVAEGDSVSRLILSSPVSGDWAGIGSLSRGIEIDLDIIVDGSPIPDEDETGVDDGEEPRDYGALIGRNLDDDDGNGTPDYDDESPKDLSDDDLVKLRLTSDLSGDSSEMIRLRVEGVEIRLWWQNDATGNVELVTETTEFETGRDYEIFAETRETFGAPIAIVAESTKYLGDSTSSSDSQVGIDTITLGSVQPFDLTVAPLVDANAGVAVALVAFPDSYDRDAIEGEQVEFKLFFADGTAASAHPLDVNQTKIKDRVAMVEFALPELNIERESTRYYIEASFQGETLQSREIAVVAGAARKIDMSGYISKNGRHIQLWDQNGNLLVSDLTPYRDGILEDRTYVYFKVDVRDDAGNPVADGTDVSWTAYDAFSSALFESAPENLQTKDGRAWTAVALKHIPPATDIGVIVDNVAEVNHLHTGGLQLTVTAEQEGLIWNTAVTNPEIDLQSPGTIVLTVEVRDANGQLVPDGTPVHWNDTKGMLHGSERVTSRGKAKTNVEFLARGAFADASALGTNKITVSVGSFRQTTTVDVVDSRAITLELTNPNIGRLPDNATSYINDDGFRSANVELESTQLNDDLTENSRHVMVSEGAFLIISGLVPGRSYRIRLENNERGIVSLARNTDPWADGYWNNLPSTNSFEFYAADDGVARVRIDTTHILLPEAERHSARSIQYVLERETLFSNWVDVSAVGGGKGSLVVGTDIDHITRLTQSALVYGDFLWGAIAGSDDLDVGLAADIGISLIPVIGVYADIRDLGKQLFRGASNLIGVDSFGTFSGVDALIAAAGIIAEPLPPVDYVIDALRISKKLAKASAVFTPVVAILEPIMVSALESMWDYYWRSGSTASTSGGSGFNTSGPSIFTSKGDELAHLLSEIIGGLSKAEAGRIGDWVDVLLELASNKVAGDGKKLDSFMKVFSQGEGGRIAAAVDTLVTRLGPDEFLAAIAKADALAESPEAFIRGVVALGETLAKSGSGNPSFQMVNFVRSLKAKPELAGEAIAKLGKFVDRALKLGVEVQDGIDAIPSSASFPLISEALATAVEAGSLRTVNQLRNFSNDLMTVAEVARSTDDIRKIQGNLRKMRNPGSTRGTLNAGQLNGHAFEITVMANQIRGAAASGSTAVFKLNHNVNNTAGKKITDIDVLRQMFIKEGARTTAIEAKATQKALGLAEGFITKLLGYKHGLDDADEIKLALPEDVADEIWEAAHESLRRADDEGKPGAEVALMLFETRVKKIAVRPSLGN